MNKLMKSSLSCALLVSLGLMSTACGAHPIQKTEMKAKHEVRRIENNMTPNMAPGTGNRMITGRDSTVSPEYAPNVNRVQIKTNNNMHVNVNDHKEKQMSRDARNIKGVSKATVVVHNKNAVVGLDLNSKQKKSNVERQVHNTLKKKYPGYTIHVTTDKGIHQRIQTVYTNRTNGHPVQNFANDVGVIITDIGRTITAPFR